MFGVNVVSVHTAIFNGKTKRMGMHEGTKSDWKKAIVTIDTIVTIEVIGSYKRLRSIGATIYLLG